jgi:hypothetical protein
MVVMSARSAMSATGASVARARPGPDRNATVARHYPTRGHHTGAWCIWLCAAADSSVRSVRGIAVRPRIAVGLKSC